MNKKQLFILVLLISFSTTVFPWGENGHKLINSRAIELLPLQMNDFLNWKDFISEHSVDADNRKSIDHSEGIKHYIDIDFYKEFLAGKMIQDKAELDSLYGAETVNNMGTLPWATLNTYFNLINSLKEKNKDSVLIYAADLGHYVADGHQPMHTLVNYNGQLTNQKGIHARYEIFMFDKHLDELNNLGSAANVKALDNPLNFIFNYIFDANSVSPVLFSADAASSNLAGGVESDEYYRLLWFKTSYITKIQVQKAAEDFASLLYSAWLTAGKPGFND